MSQFCGASDFIEERRVTVFAPRRRRKIESLNANYHNMNFPNMQLTLLALICFISVPRHAVATEKQQWYPTLSSFGHTYENSCSPASRRRLRTELLAEKIAGKAQLLKAIDILLCAAATPANKRYIASIMASTVLETNEGTGQDPHYDLIKPSNDSTGSLLAAGKAWNTTVDFQHDHVNVNYKSDEVCVTGRTLIYVNERWRITGIDQACD